MPSQTTFLTMVRSRRRFSSSVAESTALGEGLDHFLMKGKLLMQHPALLSEGFQLGKAQLLGLALLMERVDLLHDVLRGGVAGNGQGLHQPLDAIFRLDVLFPEQRKLCVVALLVAADDLLGLRQQLSKGLLSADSLRISSMILASSVLPFAVFIEQTVPWLRSLVEHI